MARKKASGLNKNAEKALSALAYPVGIISIILLIIAKKKNHFGRYHGFQALFWNMAFIVVYIVLSFMEAIIGIGSKLGFGNLITGINAVFISLVMGLLWLAFLGFSIWFAVQAAQGEKFKIPIIYNWIPESER